MILTNKQIKLILKKQNFLHFFELFHKCTENTISHTGHNFCRQVTKCTCNNNEFPQEWTALEKRTCSCCHCCFAILHKILFQNQIKTGLSKHLHYSFIKSNLQSENNKKFDWWYVLDGHWSVNSVLRREIILNCKVHIFWEGHKILRNLHLTFDWHYIGQK